MAVRARDLPAVLLGRIAQSHPAPAQFARGETDEWPDGTLAALLEAGIVYHANRADVVICPGCEWQCHKAVSVRTSAANRVKTTIMCDEEPRHGRIPVALSLLDRFATSLRTLAGLIARELELETHSPSASGSFYSLGEIKGRLGRRPVGVGIEEEEVQLIIGSERVPLVRAIRWSGEVIEIDHRLSSWQIARASWAAVRRTTNQTVRASGSDPGRRRPETEPSIAKQSGCARMRAHGLLSLSSLQYHRSRKVSAGPACAGTRAKAGGFLDLCYTPALAAEVTLQPIRRFGFDAAILFADILLVPDAMGQAVRFAEGEGPLLDPIRDAAGIARLSAGATRLITTEGKRERENSRANREERK